MGNHLTPTELARESGLERREVLSKCVEMGIPVFQGRIDKSLFLASLQGAPALSPQARSETSARNPASQGRAAPSAS